MVEFERKLGSATREPKQKAGVFLGLITEDTNLQWARSPQIMLKYESMKSKLLRHFWTPETKKKILEEFEKCSRYRGGFTIFKDFMNHWEDRCKGIIRDDKIALDIYLDNLSENIRNIVHERGITNVSDFKQSILSLPDKALEWKIGQRRFDNTHNRPSTSSTSQPRYNQSQNQNPSNSQTRANPQKSTTN